ncbi:cell wall adhesin EAP1 [Folsomia candida]|uniref:cell wall adhesin EAP1 n=1 Tax=Folsomia candida TaxID=158441 RepID=UPI000B8F480A|nr:cell wall adhesin EAP1 [Folsomia candida]
MGFKLICMTALSVFVVVTILLDCSVAKNIYQNNDSNFLRIKWRIGILDELTNDTCVDELPFPDPDDITWFYQCFLAGDYYVLVHLECDTGGYYDEISGACEEFPVTEPPTTPEPTTPAPFQCGDVEGKFPDPSDCTKYNRCVLVSGVMRLYKYVCTAGSYFDEAQAMCVVGVCPGSTSPTTESSLSTEPSTVPTTTAEPTTTPAPTTTAAPTTPPPFQCGTIEGTFPEPTDCTKYNRCVMIAGVMRLYAYTCPAGSYFDQAKALCVLGTCPATSPPTTLPPATTAGTTGSTTPPAVTTTAAPATTAVTTTTVSTTITPFQCGTTEGTFPDSTDCTKYNRCVLIAGAMRLYSYTCPAGSYFDQVNKLCSLGTC